MTTTSETAKVGDKVWCVKSGWGEIRETEWTDRYPIAVYFQSDEFKTYTAGGLHEEDDISQTLFWDEVTIVAPEKPIPDFPVDTKVLVWRDGSRNKFSRHFSHFENNNIHVFDGGLSSWTGNLASVWDHWELAE